MQNNDTSVSITSQQLITNVALSNKSFLSSVFDTLAVGLPRQMLSIFFSSPTIPQQQQLQAPLRTRSFVLCYIVLIIFLLSFAFIEQPSAVRFFDTTRTINHNCIITANLGIFWAHVPSCDNHSQFIFDYSTTNVAQHYHNK